MTMRPEPTSWPKCLGEFEQRRGDAAFERQKTPGRDRRIGFAKAHGEKLDQRLVNLEMILRECLKRSAAEKLNLASRTATTEAERGGPSIIESSPTMAPGPRNARIRSLPVRETIVTLSNPSSMR